MGVKTSTWLGLPTLGALGGGGILLIWDDSKVVVPEHEIGAYSVSIRCKSKFGLEEWVFVGVYGSPLGGGRLMSFWLNWMILRALGYAVVYWW